MSEFDFDLFVIGGGSGGVRAARMAAQRGARVALAEARGLPGLGGTCVTLGCIPKKLYRYAAAYAHAFTEARGYGWQVPTPPFDWARLRQRRAAEVARLNGVYETLLRNAGVTLLLGQARLHDAHTVTVRTRHPDGSATEQHWRARHILVATGGIPHVPHFHGREHVITSNEVFDLEPFPQRLVVVGGGYIACEFASIFHGLGAQVTLLYRGEQILRGFDDEVRHYLAAELVREGIDLRLRSGVVAVQRADGGLRVQLEDGAQLDADAVLYATGRVPNVAGLGLETVGVAQGALGAIVVDEHFRTNVPSIYALGDVTARVQLTPVALAEAMALVDHLFGPPPGAGPRHARYDLIPTAVFTDPEVATVGWTQEQALQRCDAVRIYRSIFRPLRHTLSGRAARTLVKLLVDDASDRVVGLHMVGSEAAEIVQGFAVALRAGATKAEFDATLGIHPTVAEEFVTLREPAAIVRRTP
ncbi:glutathione-disulfide reductase [Tepidimonas charontis]|uniref:Glutathione amide reductase n=1 Tax=Tepidimonas charontis TaxID=2267262 RepID=A0A554X8N4_9BURK|nr:glutathione-disulfide reductase [Tepidimonas charontis]TSE32197.1 Glutathione amide reductase [Tepidimonas charontis]